MGSKTQRPAVARDPHVSGTARTPRVVHARSDRPNAQRAAGEVVDHDAQLSLSAGVQTTDMTAQCEAPLRALVLGPERAESAGAGQDRDCSKDERDSRRGTRQTSHTTIVRLFTLCGPRQFAVAGVIVYCHDPAGTPFSVQVSAAIVPEQLLPMVCSTPVVAL